MEPKIGQRFWDIISSSSSSLCLLCRTLEQIPKQEVIEYQRQFEEAKSAVNPLYRADFASFVDDGTSCSDDEADDFAAWVVMQGKSFFESAVNDPVQLFAFLKSFQESDDDTTWDEKVDRPEYRGYQRADYVAVPIYRSRFREELGEVV